MLQLNIPDPWCSLWEVIGTHDVKGKEKGIWEQSPQVL